MYYKNQQNPDEVKTHCMLCIDMLIDIKYQAYYNCSVTVACINISLSLTILQYCHNCLAVIQSECIAFVDFS